MSPLVSCVIPAYNAAPYIADAIRSVLAQSWARIEVIVVNDGSQDETLRVSRTFVSPRVHVLDQPNRGAAAARNHGLREAQGQLIQFLDADDLLAPDKVEEQVKRLGERPDCLAACRWGRFQDSLDNVRFTPEPFWQDMAPIDWLVSRWERSSMMHPAGWLVPRSVIERAGPWDETLTLDDDGEFFDRMVLASTGILFCDNALSYYRSGVTGSLSGSRSAVAWDSQFRSLSLGASRILKAEDSLRTRRACSRGFEEFVYGSFPAVPELRGQAWKRVRELGGPYFSPQMGPRLRMLSWVLGWKMAKWLQAVGRRLGCGR